MSDAGGDIPFPRRLALLIGNGKYSWQKNRLSYATQNVRALEAKLVLLEFQVTKIFDLKKEILQEIATFAETIREGDLVIFYYAGHCFQKDGRNFLIPVGDTNIKKDVDVALFGCAADDALNKLTEKQPCTTIFILDSYKRYMCTEGTTANTPGLARMTPSEGVLIQFACGVNQIVGDANGTNRENLFAKCLIERIAKPNRRIIDIFRWIARSVSKESGGSQKPLTMQNMVSRHDIYLKEKRRTTQSTEDVDESSTHRRLALLIGNGEYSAPRNHLAYATRNANELETKFVSLGFQVTKIFNVEAELMRVIADFASNIQDGDLVVFYFAGHCCQVEGNNYLLAVNDRNIKDYRSVLQFGCRASNALDRLTEKNQSYMTIFILDCFNEYAYSTGAAANPSGLAPIEVRQGAFIQYACGASQIVNDAHQTDRDNLFANCLLQHICTPNVSVSEMFQQVTLAVEKRSGGTQRPLYMNGLGQDGQACFKREIPKQLSGEEIIDSYNKHIRDLELELEELTLLGPMYNGASYNELIGSDIGAIKALIHLLKLERKDTIKSHYKRELD